VGLKPDGYRERVRDSCGKVLQAYRSVDGAKSSEDVMESATFRRWLSERGCSFDAGKDTVRTQGHAYVTVRLGDRRAVLPDIGSDKRPDPRVVRKIVDELGLDWNELPGPTPRV
jgi:hypothetical protein